MVEASLKRHVPLGLEWILAPVTRDVFLDSYWEKSALLIERPDRGYFADLPGLDVMDEIITATASGPSRSDNDGHIVKTEPDGTQSQRAIQLLKNGVPDIQDVYRSYAAGYSVVVNQVHARCAAVASLCRALERDLHHPVGANLYLTPAGAQGFPPHADTHDVFILQLHGDKEWHVTDASYHLPLASWKHTRDASLHHYRKYTLTPGDALYLPRGAPHEAVTASTSSLHLTVGIHVYRWVDLLSEALQLLAEEEPALRGALPPKFLDHPADIARVSRLVSELAASLDADLTGRAANRLAAKLLDTGKAAGRGQFRSIDAVPGLRHDSVIRRVPGHLCRVRSSADEVMIEFATNYVSGPAYLTPTMKFIAENEKFIIGALPGALSADDKIELVGRLISEGFLTCTDIAERGGTDDTKP